MTQINAGRAIDIEAVNGSINSQGAQISAGTDPLWQRLGDDKAGDITLTAGKDINLTSAVGKQESDSKSNASGLQVGVSTSPVPVTGNGYYDKGKSQSNGTYNVNTHVNGTGNITLISKGDTNISGGTVTGNSIKADIGGSLNITSLVDTQNVNLNHTTITAGFGNNSANFDYTKQKGNGNSQTIPEQSGFYAGDGGFDIKVNNNTNLTGGVISSTADADKNRLETGTLTWSDVATSSEWETSTKGFGATIGTGQQGAPGTGPLIKPTLKDGDSDTGSARAAISPGQIIITTPDEQTQDIAELNRDTSNTNDTIDALPDLQKSLNEQLKTQQEWSQAAQTITKFIGDKTAELYVQAKIDGNQAEMEFWKEGGPGSTILHAIAGGLLGGVNGVDGALSGAFGGASSAMLAPKVKEVVGEIVKQAGLTGTAAEVMTNSIAGSILQGLGSAAGSTGGAYAGNAFKYNYLGLHDLQAYQKALAKCQGSEDDYRACAQKVWDEEGFAEIYLENRDNFEFCLEINDYACIDKHVAAIMEARDPARELRQELVGLMSPNNTLTEPNNYALDLMRGYYINYDPSEIVDIRNQGCPGGATNDTCRQIFADLNAQDEERLNQIMYPILGVGVAAIAIPVIIYGGGGAAIAEGGALATNLYRTVTAARVATTAYEGTAAVRVVSTVGGSVSNSTTALYGSWTTTSPQLLGLTADKWILPATAGVAGYYSIQGVNNFTGVNLGRWFLGRPDQSDEIRDYNSNTGYKPTASRPQIYVTPNQGDLVNQYQSNTGTTPAPNINPIISTPIKAPEGPTIYNQVPGDGLQAHENAGLTKDQIDTIFPTSSNANKSVINELMPNGQLIGTKTGGSRFFVRTLSPEDFSALQTKLLEGATKGARYGDNGQFYDLPSGGKIGIRTSKNNGVTLDFDVPGISNKFKIHQSQ